MKRPQEYLFFKGLPGSGKSTMAKKLLDDHASCAVYKRINKDLMREMLDNGHHTKDNEKFVLECLRDIIFIALEEGYSIIDDNTNLNPYHEEQAKLLVKRYNENCLPDKQVIFRIIDLTTVPIEICLERDSKRQNYVGEKVIRDMYNKYIKPNNTNSQQFNTPWKSFDPNLPNAVIIDIDGTLALRHSDREIYEFEKAGQDEVNQPVKEITKRAFEYQDIVIIVSAREDKWKDVTTKWLSDNGIPYDHIFMRKTGDDRKDAIIKEEIYNTHIKDKFNVKYVVDDRSRVCQKWRDLGLVVFQVQEGNY